MAEHDLLSCPFCGEELEFSENLSIHGGGWMHHGDEAERDKSCFLIGKIVYNTPGDLERWNRRSVTSQASEGADETRKLFDEAADFAERMTGQPWACELVERLADALEASLVAPVSKRVERLETALNLALAMLIKFEPPDSRAVSDEFVAMAAISAGGDTETPECIDIVNRALQALQGGRS